MKHQYDMMQTNGKFQRDLNYKVLKEDTRKHLYNFDMKQKDIFDYILQLLWQETP